MRKKYEVFVDGDLTYSTEDKTKAETMGRFLLGEGPGSVVAIREWTLSGVDEVSSDRSG